MKRSLACLAIALAFVPTAVGGSGQNTPSQFRGHRVGDQAWQWQYKKWMTPHAQRLGACESGSPVDRLNFGHSSSYEGVFGFAPSTWDSFKPVSWWPQAAYLATPWQQYVVARRVAARYGIASPWGCWRGDQHAWVRGSEPYYSRSL